MGVYRVGKYLNDYIYAPLRLIGYKRMKLLLSHELQLTIYQRLLPTTAPDAMSRPAKQLVRRSSRANFALPFKSLSMNIRAGSTVTGMFPALR